MKRFYLLIAMGCVVLTSAANDKNSSSPFVHLLNTKEDLPADYKKAKDLVDAAQASLLEGNVKVADSLIRKSIALYPIVEVFEYAKKVGELPDLIGANQIADLVIARVKSLPEGKFMAREPLPLTLDNGVAIAAVKAYEKNRGLFNFCAKKYQMNKEFGARKWIEGSLLMTLEPQIPKIKNKKEYDYEYNMQEGFKIELANMQGDYDQALKIINEIPKSAFFSEDLRKAYLSGVWYAKGDYGKVVEIGKTISNEQAAAGHLFNAYAYLGKPEEAIENYYKYPEQYRENNSIYYSLALIDLAKNNYKAALQNLKTSMKLRVKGGMESFMLVNAWELHKTLGDTYAGLKENEKARDHYKIALLYYPEYKPALDALTNFEAKFDKDVSADKTPPVIALTEPAPGRGLKITAAGTNVMVKGIATDVSGIKEVLINGKSVYSQANGVFWGDVPMVDGLNKLSVIAVDLAGNKAESTFEVEKKQAPVIAGKDIAPVLEKEGKQYCLLLAAQNYSDSTIPSLENPIADAIKLKLILKNNYSFADQNIISLFNPSGNDVKRQLLELTNTIQPEDDVLIFYAGHGIWVEKEKKGYWLLTDSKFNDTKTWLPNNEVLALIAKLPSRHTLLITDACFSGSVFKTRGLKPGMPTAIKEMENKISRVAITSGNDTEVPDKSVFMKHLVKALSENKDQYLTAQKMFVTQIIEAVMTESKTEPRYGTLESAGHIGGDYIFTKK